MARKADAILDLLGETLSDWREDKAPRLAAALAYYTTFSLAPLLMLVTLIAGSVMGGSQQASEHVVAQIEAVVGHRAAGTIATLMGTAPAGGGGILAGVVGVAVLLLGATGVFVQLQDALNTIWGVAAERRRGVWVVIKDRFLSLMMVMGMSFVLLLSLVISASLSFVSAHFDRAPEGLAIVAGPVSLGVSLGVVTLVFAALFKVLPDTHVAWKDVWSGALITAFLFTIGKEILGLYLGRGSISSAYGAAGYLVVILAWVYYSTQILFLGAEFTRVYARRRGARNGRESMT